MKWPSLKEGTKRARSSEGKELKWNDPTRGSSEGGGKEHIVDWTWRWRDAHFHIITLSTPLSATPVLENKWQDEDLISFFGGRSLVGRGRGIRLNIILSTVCYQPCSVSPSNKEKNRNDSICIIPLPSICIFHNSGNVSTKEAPCLHLAHRECIPRRTSSAAYKE